MTEVCVFVVGGGERYAFKCMSARLRKGFTAYKTAMTFWLPVPNLKAFSFLLFFFLSCLHAAFSM